MTADLTEPRRDRCGCLTGRRGVDVRLASLTNLRSPRRPIATARTAPVWRVYVLIKGATVSNPIDKA